MQSMAFNESSVIAPTRDLVLSLFSFSLLTSVATPGNGLLIAAFVYNRRLRNITNTLVIGLACADILVGLVCIPCWMYVVVKQYHHVTVDFFSYQFYITADIFIGSASILQLTCISLERCHAVVKPIKHRLLSKKKFYCALSAAWVCAGLVASLQPIQYQRWQKVYTTLLAVVCFVIPLLVIIIAYAKIFLTTRSSLHTIHTKHYTQKAVLAREIRLSLTVVIITVLFVLAWLPLFVLTLMATFTPKHLPESSLVLMFVKWMHYGSSAINPFLYAFRNNEIKCTIRVMLCRFFLRKGPNLKELSYSGGLRSASSSIHSRRSSCTGRRMSKSLESGRKKSSSSDGNNNGFSI